MVYSRLAVAMAGLAALVMHDRHSWSLAAQTSAAIDREAFDVADGFEISLFASDPAIAKPIQMNFDAKGRLWVVTSQSYPQLVPGAEPNDKVFVLEDANGDGKADKTTTFADGLLIPTGIEIGGGGAYVGHSTEVLFLRDTDGDGRADQSRVLLSGFGTEDTHHLVHTFRWGPGGWLHFAQSIYIHSHVETPLGVKRLNGGGFWLCRPDSLELDVLVHGMVNSWGIAFDDFGQAIGVDNDEASSIYYFLPGAKLRHTPGETHILGGIVTAKPKYCGAEFVTGRHFPNDWQGDFVTCDFRAHRVCRFKLKDDGAGFAASEQAPLLQTRNPAFRPVDVKMGPDGALYVCDWYNPIINHGEVDFRDPRRDRTQGRIWRVAAKNRPLLTRPKLVAASIDELLEAQKAPEEWTRHFARRVLAERPKDDVLARLGAWSDQQTDELVRLRALWVYQTLDAPNGQLLRSLLSASDGRIRAAAVRVLDDWLDQTPGAMTLLQKLVDDDHPRVRLEAVRALARVAQPNATGTALAALAHPMDRFLDYALRLTARETSAHWLPEITQKAATGIAAEEAARWVYALLALESPQAAGPLAKLWEANRVPENQSIAVLDSIARFGDGQQLETMFAFAQRAAAGSRLNAALRVLEALAEAQRVRGVRPNGDLAAAIVQLLAIRDRRIEALAFRLAGLWKLQSLADLVIARASDQRAHVSIRDSAIDALGDLAGKSCIASLVAIAGDKKDALRHRAIGVLVPLDSARAARLAKTALLEKPSAKAASAVFQSFLRHRGGPAALAKELASVSLPASIAQVGVRLANAAAQPAPELVAVLIKAGSLPETVRELSAQQLARLIADVKTAGRAEEGEKIYRREKLGCIKCHAIKGVGGAVGPDLATIGASAPLDYIIESLLLPNKKVKENYHAQVVATKDGAVVTGIPVSKSAEILILRDAENRTVTIPVREIEESRTSGSIMPADLMDSLDSQELVHLARFLSELGTPGPYGPTSELVAREWRMLGPFSADESSSIGERLIAAGPGVLAAATGWQSSLTTFAGWVYLREFALNPRLPIYFAVCAIEAKKPGKVRLMLEPASAAACWLDGRPLKPLQVVGADAHYDVELKSGVQHLLVRIDLGTAPNFLKLRGFPLDPAAEFQFVSSLKAQQPN